MFGQGRVEILGNPKAASVRPKRALGRALEGDEARDRTPTPCDHHLLTRFDALEELGKLGFRLVNVDLRHLPRVD